VPPAPHPQRAEPTGANRPTLDDELAP
jgi:hypothetical protein